MFRRYESKASRFSQPDPYDGSYNLTDPQSFNRYSYTQNDPVNFTDPSGLSMSSGLCTADMSFTECYGSGGVGFWRGNSGRGGSIYDRDGNGAWDPYDWWFHFGPRPQGSIEIINTGGDTAFERNKDKILDLITRMAKPDGPCAAAFKRAGLPTPGDVLAKGLILGSKRALTDSAYNKVLGIPDHVRQKFNNRSRGSALTILGSDRGVPIILFGGDSFVNGQFMEDVPHEMSHAAGQRPMPFILWPYNIQIGHDLVMWENYEDIIASCK